MKSKNLKNEQSYRSDSSSNNHPQHSPLAQVIDSCQAYTVTSVRLQFGYGVLFILATIHLSPLPITAKNLKDERRHPGAIVLHVACGPPGSDGRALPIIALSPSSSKRLKN